MHNPAHGALVRKAGKFPFAGDYTTKESNKSPVFGLGFCFWFNRSSTLGQTDVTTRDIWHLFAQALTPLNSVPNRAPLHSDSKMVWISQCLSRLGLQSVLNVVNPQTQAAKKAIANANSVATANQIHAPARFLWNSNVPSKASAAQTVPMPVPIIRRIA